MAEVQSWLVVCGRALCAVVFFCMTWSDVSAAADSIETFRDCSDCPEMVSIPAGAFMMGTSREDLSSSNVPEPFASYQMPLHEVEISRSFAIGKFPITKAEFQAFARATGREEPAQCWSWNVAAEKYEQQTGLAWSNPGFPQTETDPAVCVSWFDAQAYADWLSEVTGFAYRLPSESEREYVARAGAMTPWPWGAEAGAICDHANVSDLSRVAVHESTQKTSETIFECEDDYVYTSPVGSFATNAFGLYDTLGNVWEWQADCFQDSYDGASPEGAVFHSEACEQRTLRGGSWFTFTFLNMPSARYGTSPDDRSGHVGFRVARSIE